jgi:peptidoglycan hydrolase-like protein with peptidoglycan-binding domain
MRRVLFSLIATLLLTCAFEASAQSTLEPDDPAFTERRVALVVGNAGYGPKVGPLRNPANDATDIAAALRDVGFDVALRLDVDRDQLRRAVIDFGRSLQKGGVGLFYFSGHAVQLDGRNYMIPLGAEVEHADYVGLETVDIDEVLARMGAADNRLNIVILDACRNNPFKGIFRAPVRGLAQTRAPTGTFIAYAAAPGALARDGTSGSRNSPYTAALLRSMQEPGLRLEDVFKRVRLAVLTNTDGFQTPWTGSSITGDFYFRLPEPLQANPEPPASASPPSDLVFWNAIEDSRNPADFETFLEVHPTSALAPLARRRLEDLSNTSQTAVLPSQAVSPQGEPEPDVAAPATPDPASIEAALGLTRDQRAVVQFALAELGHDPGAIDGLLGPRSRAAIDSWQEKLGETPTGYLSESQVTALLSAVDPAALEGFRQQTAEPPALLSSPAQFDRPAPSADAVTTSAANQQITDPEAETNSAPRGPNGKTTPIQGPNIDGISLGMRFPLPQLHTSPLGDDWHDVVESTPLHWDRMTFENAAVRVAEKTVTAISLTSRSHISKEELWRLVENFCPFSHGRNEQFTFLCRDYEIRVDFSARTDGAFNLFIHTLGG